MIKRLLAWLFGKKPKASSDKVAAAEAEQFSEAEEKVIKAVIHSLLEQYSVRASYCRNIDSDGAANEIARSLPLFYVWGQTEGKNGTEFHFGTNGFHVSTALSMLIPFDSPRFRPIRDHIQRRLHAAAYDVLVAECQQLELTPIDVCDDWKV